MARIIGLLLMLLLLMAAIMSKGGILLFIDVGSFLIVTGGVYGALLLSFGLGVRTAPRALFNRQASMQDTRLGVEVFERAKSYAIGWGIIGTFTGAILMLANLDDPDALGPGLAVALITMYYGLLLAYGIFMPCASILQVRLASEDNQTA